MVVRLLSVIRRSLSKRMLIYLLLVVLMQIAVMGLIGHRLIFGHIETILDDKTRELNRSLVQEVNNIRNGFERHADRIAANQVIQDLLLMENTGEISLEQYLRYQTETGWILMDPENRISSILAGSTNTYQSRASAYRFISYEEIAASEVYRRASLSDGASIWVALQEDIITERNAPGLYLCKTINLIHYDFRVLGTLIMQIPFDMLGNVFSRGQMVENEYFAVTDESGVVIYHSKDGGLIGGLLDDSLLGLLDERSDLVKTIGSADGPVNIYFSPFISEAGRTGWNIIHAVPATVPNFYAVSIRNLVLGIMLILLVVSIPLFIFLLKSITKPIINLKNTVAAFGGDLHTRAKVDRKDEIGDLQESFNRMAGDIEQLLDKEADNNRQLRELELTALEYQINPHFLYNSLDSLYWMARKSGSGQVAEMVHALADFFRIGFGRKQEAYYVKDEIGHVRQFLMINKLRLKDSFEFDISVCEDILELPIVKIMLQPIVENAVKYGAEKSMEKGSVHVRGFLDAGNMVFEVADNGPGIPEGRLSAINRSFSEHGVAHESENGFGLYYVNQRLRLYYGEGTSVRIENRPEGGVVVRIVIPG